MTSFLDGPAKGQVLTLHRTPVFLRVTNDGDTWDALDQLEDEPNLTETLHAYQVHRVLGSAFIDGTDKRGRRSGYRVNIVEYAIVHPQPDQQTMRDVSRWQAWCEAQPKRVRS